MNVAAYLYIPLPLRGAAVGLFALLRNEGGSFGTSMVAAVAVVLAFLVLLMKRSVAEKRADFAAE